ncbi:MAG: S1 RNA-binding domain-containing protein, partial [Polyangiales bacterium]
VEGVVFGFNRGGFDVLVGSLRAFCPASAMSLGPIEDPHHLLGQCLAFRITPPKNQSQTLVVSRRSLLEKHARKAAAARLSSLKEGERLPGKVTAIRDYGILVDVGDVEGLVHLSELSWIRGKKPSEVVTLGEEITVQVLKVQPATRKDRLGKLSLSKRLAEPDPWQNASEGLAPGKAHVGRVVATTEFGAFVEILPGVQGLLHISELGRNLQHANAALAVDAEVGVVVERVDRKQRRLSLSRLSEADMLALQAGELDKVQAAPRIGVTLEVVIEKVEHQGLVVRAQGVLGRRGRGYLPNRELGSDKNAEFRRGLKQGATLQVKVTGTDRDGGFRASLRAREVDEERQAVKAYRKEAAKQGLGTFGDLLRAKLGGQMQAKD